MLAAVRIAWGIMLVVAPRRLIAHSRRHSSQRVPVNVLRMLGLRHLLQAVTTLAVPETAVVEIGAGTDALHAMTALGLAATSRPWRRAALADGAAAGIFGVAGWLLRPRQDQFPDRNPKGRSSMTKRRVAVVTGGTAGVGRAVVRELADHGWDVGVLARGQAGLDGAVADVQERGGQGLGVSTDVAVLDQVRSAADRIEDELGPIELWVNVAFSGSLRFFWDTDDTVFRRITEVTYLGMVNGTRVALEYMRPRNKGVIIQTGSALAYRGIPLQSAYCGAKHALIGFTESIITELKHEKSAVRLCMVQLPAVNTVQFDWNDSQFDEHPMPVPPIFQPEVPAHAVRYLADHPRRNLWVGASTAGTVIANRLAPNLLDWYLGKTGVKSQTTHKEGPRYGSNVFQAKDDKQDRGAHGMFDEQAHSSDPWSAVSMRRTPIAAGFAGSVVGAAVLAITVARRTR
jgi:NAD(P)-dependent dehydrogenase (short-subunit alcohol dehydrogenase family)